MEEATVTFKYEYLQYEKFGQPINEDTGFQSIDALDIENNTTTSLFVSQPQIFNEQTNNDYQRNFISSADFVEPVVSPIPTTGTVPGATGRETFFG